MKIYCECDDEAPPYSRYYDTPDGCDTQTKAIVLGRYGLATGLFCAFYDVTMYSHAVGAVNVMKRILFHTVPLGLMGVTFAVVTNTVLQMRNVDDKLNYFIGGVATSPIAAAYIGHPIAILPAAAILGASAVVKKTIVDANTCAIPKLFSHMGSINSWRHDYTLAEDPKDEIRRKCEALVEKYREELRRRRRGEEEPSEDECEDEPKGKGKK